MSLNQSVPEGPEPTIAPSAVLLGEASLGAGVLLAQGVVLRAHSGAVKVGNHSAVLENSSLVGTPDDPVVIGQRTVFGHRCQVVGARLGDLCEIGNGSILMPGARLGMAASSEKAPSSRPAWWSLMRPCSWAGPRTCCVRPPTRIGNG